MQTVVILGTGGTIAGTQDDPARAWHYQAAQLSVAQLVDAVPALKAVPLETLQVAQIDSKDMGWSVWRSLGHALHRQLARPDVAGVVITHGTDTLEETAYLLHRLLDVNKPVVLTAAMRPATSSEADGPGNLRDAVHVVQEAARRGLGGVLAVLHGRVWRGAQVRKAHAFALEAFDAGGEAPLAMVDAHGALSDAAVSASWPGASGDLPWQLLDAESPRVEILTSHADADGWLLDAALAHPDRARPLKGVIVAGSGHGTIHQGLEAALRRAEATGVVIWRSTRVARGGVMGREGDAWPACGPLTPGQARVALVLHLLQGTTQGRAS